MIGSIEPNGRIQIDSKFPPHIEFDDNMQGALFPLEIKEDIDNSKAFTAADASCENNQMGGYWIIANATKQYEQENKLYHKNWKANTSKGAEAIALLDLLTAIEKKGQKIECGKIEIAVDNLKVRRGTMNEILKLSIHTQDAGAEIVQIRKLLKKIKFEVDFKLVRGHKTPSGPFQTKTAEHLMRMCDNNARIVRETCDDKENETNMKYAGFWAMSVNGNMSTNSVKETMRNIDAEKSLTDHVKIKCKHQADFIDLEARRAFNNKDVTPSVIKCTHGFNHYGVRDAAINKGVTEVECPRCNQIETWDHVIRCGKVLLMQVEFVKETIKELRKHAKEDVDNEIIIKMMKDMVKYFKGDEDQHGTLQQYAGFKDLFRGFVVKDWDGPDFNCRKHTYLNKILVKKVVLFYSICWKHRNDVYHNEEKQRERLIKWHERIKLQVEMHEPEQVKIFMRRNKIDATRCKNETIRLWISNVNELRKKVEKLPANDIRRHFKC